jgi:hypothetical protein
MSSPDRIDLGLLGDAALLDVVGQRAGERGAEAGQVGTAVLLRNVVGEAEHRFLVGVGPLHGTIDDDAVLFAGDRDHIGVQRGLQLGQVLDEAADAAFVLEHVVLAIRALIDQFDLDAGVEEGQFAQALGQDVVVEFDVVVEAVTEGQKRTSVPRLSDASSCFSGYTGSPWRYSCW